MLRTPDMKSSVGDVQPARELVPAGALLDTWSAHQWSQGVMVDRLAVLDRLMIQTRHSQYEIVVMTPETADVLVRGGAYFPVFTRAKVAGSSLGGSFLKVHGIYVGFRMEISDGSRMIVTSAVETVSQGERSGPAM
jgi:hypothetical protein